MYAIAAIISKETKKKNEAQNNTRSDTLNMSFYRVYVLFVLEAGALRFVAYQNVDRITKSTIFKPYYMRI